MATNGDLVLLDTSAALAFVDTDNPLHKPVLEATAGMRLGLAGHAAFETLSVLTRFPGAKRLSGPDAALLVRTNFPHSRFLNAEQSAELVREFGALGIVGGSVYDGLVASAARAHGCPLVSCDTRAAAVYDALRVECRLITLRSQ